VEEKTDLILVGHSHGDHYSPNEISKFWKKMTVVLAQYAFVSLSISPVTKDLCAG